jgi:urease accessory protein
LSGVLELLLADARTPSGGYAHSGGLEAALADGVCDVPGFIRARLHTIGRCQAAIAARATACGSLDELLELDGEAAARTPVAALRAADRRLGLGLLRTAGVLWPGDELLAGYRAASRLTPRAVALGAVCRSAGLDPGAAARLSLYEDAASVAAAAVKLTALDAAAASGWVAGLAGEIEALASAAARPGPLPSTATPLLDQRALVHAAGDGRLFAS